MVVRVAVVTESFLPEVNGVTNSVLRVLEHLQRRGHQALVVAPGRGGRAVYAGVAVARRLAVPAVAVYQTDVAGFLARYGLGVAEPATWRWLQRIHRRAALTLAPSSHTVAALARHGITGVEIWRRGVDAERFH